VTIPLPEPRIQSRVIKTQFGEFTTTKTDEEMKAWQKRYVESGRCLQMDYQTIRYQLTGEQ
jgi:hypothetical protein